MQQVIVDRPRRDDLCRLLAASCQDLSYFEPGNEDDRMAAQRLMDVVPALEALEWRSEPARNAFKVDLSGAMVTDLLRKSEQYDLTILADQLRAAAGATS